MVYTDNFIYRNAFMKPKDTLPKFNNYLYWQIVYDDPDLVDCTVTVSTDNCNTVWVNSEEDKNYYAMHNDYDSFYKKYEIVKNWHNLMSFEEFVIAEKRKFYGVKGNCPCGCDYEEISQAMS